MGLFKSGKAKADDLLSILIPSLQWQMQEELKKRLAAQMEDVVREAANQVIGYGYDEAIKELTVQVSATKRQWVGLTDDERNEMIGRIQHDQYTRQRDLINSTQIITEMYLKEKNGAT